MNLSIVPHKMESGMIVAIQVKTDEKEEIFAIPPAPFETFEGMKAVIAKHYETEDLWIAARKEYESVKERFDLIDFRHTAALQDFKLLIAPKIEPKPATETKAPIAKDIVKTEQDVQQLLAHPTPKPEQDVPIRKIIAPQETLAEQAQQASIAMAERAEKAGDELKNAPVIIVAKELVQVQEPPISQDSQMVKLMKEHPTILTPEIKDLLSDKANKVLDSVAGHIKVAQDAANLDKPLVVQQPQQPISVQDWVKTVNATVTDHLENTEFDEATLEEELVKCGVPEKLLEKVKFQLIKTWEGEDRFEQKENSIILKLKNLSQKVMGRRRKKEKPV